jgi:hypothetical protein
VLQTWAGWQLEGTALLQDWNCPVVLLLGALLPSVVRLLLVLQRQLLQVHTLLPDHCQGVLLMPVDLLSLHLQQ